MDQNTLLKIARLRSLAARHGKAFDVVRFAEDLAFARQTLTQLMDTNESELLIAGLELMNALKMTASTEPSSAAAPSAAEPSEHDKRYIGRLRGL